MYFEVCVPISNASFPKYYSGVNLSGQGVEVPGFDGVLSPESHAVGPIFETLW
jgi:hypothetical protein